MWPGSHPPQLRGGVAQQKRCDPPLPARISQLEGQQRLHVWPLWAVAERHSAMYWWVAVRLWRRILNALKGQKIETSCFSHVFHRKKVTYHWAPHASWKMCALESWEIWGGYRSLQSKKRNHPSSFEMMSAHNVSIQRCESDRCFRSRWHTWDPETLRSPFTIEGSGFWAPRQSNLGSVWTCFLSQTTASPSLRCLPDSQPLSEPAPVYQVSPHSPPPHLFPVPASQ